MLWFIAIVAVANPGMAIAIYRRLAALDTDTANDAAVLAAVAKINEASGRVASTGAKIQESTETLKNIENPGGNTP